MANKHASLDALFTDIADAIREKIGGTDTVVASDFPKVIRESLEKLIPGYITFTSPSSFTLAVNDATKHWDGTLEYSTDKKTWSTWDGTTTLSSTTRGSENVLYLRGTGNTVITGNSADYRWVLTGSDIVCTGNIGNLLDYATIVAGRSPTIGVYCYSRMFYGCTALTQAPALPATTLANNCCQRMFYGCTSLTQAPELPATTLAIYCYDSMFQGCTSLTQAPELPATTLAEYCYSNMFKGCTNLTQAPALPATTLVSYCYSSMFNGCTALTQAPALPATMLADHCYGYMFNNCSKIKLSTTMTEEYTQPYRIPITGTASSVTEPVTSMFYGTGGTFTGSPSINTTYYLSNTNTMKPQVDLIAITASNIADYFTVTNGTYYFNGDGTTFTTNNGGVHSSTASTVLTAKQNIQAVMFNYSYSSEANYDKFTLKVAGSTIESAVSGSTTTKAYSGSLTSGQTIEFTYTKDNSGNSNDDKCTFFNMAIMLG